MLDLQLDTEILHMQQNHTTSLAVSLHSIHVDSGSFLLARALFYNKAHCFAFARKNLIVHSISCVMITSSSSHHLFISWAASQYTL